MYKYECDGTNNHEIAQDWADTSAVILLLVVAYPQRKMKEYFCPRIRNATIFHKIRYKRNRNIFRHMTIQSCVSFLFNSSNVVIVKQNVIRKKINIDEIILCFLL